MLQALGLTYLKSMLSYIDTEEIIMDLSHLDTTELLQLMFADGGPDMIAKYATEDQICDLESLMIDHYAEKHAGGEHLVHWEASEYVH